MSTASSLPPDSPEITPTASQESLSEPIQVAVLTGRTMLRLKVKQGEAVQGPKVNIQYSQTLKTGTSET